MGEEQGGSSPKEALGQDMAAVYRMAEGDASLPALMEAIGAVLERHPQALAGVTARYRLVAEDTGYQVAFALHQGWFSRLEAGEGVDVTITGKEQVLLQILQRRLPPLAALLTRKIRLQGSKAALMKLAEFV